MAVDTRTTWVQKAEAAVTSLRGVEAVRILAEGETIREIHVLSTSSRPAKQIVRDVQSVLVTRFGREIDYRVVSVAYCEPGSVVRSTVMESALPPAPEPTFDRAPARESAPEPVRERIPMPEPAPAPASRPAPAPAPAAPMPTESPRPSLPAPPAALRDDRIRFVGVNLFVAGARTQAQVELRWKGLPRMGSASGWSTREGAHRLVAMATVSAVQEFVAHELALAVQEVEFVRLGRRRAVLVSLALLGHRSEKWLAGTCVVEQDLQQAVVLATLSALNRLVGGLPANEPTEYVLRPTST